MQAGDLVGKRFRIAKQLGTGGMGVVFRALDEDTGRQVAVKLFAWRDALEVQRAHREVQVLAQLAHPAIVRHLADGLTDAGELYLAMEWIDGRTIAKRLESDGFTLREALAAARPIASALVVSHQAGVLHRDIKPSNVVLAGNDPAAACLIDFGVARIVDGAKALTRTGTAVGTPGYMSPEQARGHRELTPATDVFGLGCLLYECISGKPAFSGTSSAAVMAKVLFSPPPPLRDLCPEVPAPVEALLERMLAKDIADRFENCAAILTALDELAPIDDGPRRNGRSLDEATQVGSRPSAPQLHCIVGAACGSPDDVLEPPSAEAWAQLIAAAEHAGAHVEVFATGAVMAHLRGRAKLTAVRAARLALEMRSIMPGWSIVISSLTTSVATAADTGATLLTNAALAAFFGKASQGVDIVVDPGTAQYLDDDFELARGIEPRLVGLKQ
ncbi:MAG TPA: serine/threonine-protein kinase [Kofleriaceae bacterium]